MSICKQLIENLPKYLLIIDGIGDGCDYTIACNLNVVAMKASTLEAAIQEAEEYFEEELDYLSREPDGERRTNKAVIVPAAAVIDFRFDRALHKRIEQANALNAQATEVAERAELTRLQDKYGAEV